ncbi:hypothetical protein [Marinobacter sp. BGYM27]|uniref:hypothetical protein n=1 Tax=unclassified Marinobacter TaxID=83889 RepID=UPI0021A658CB|nr:hypothetical protein [Marinobacter sp. BGYM27]MDG5500355.1 hypothetical protein [Marinobacter sp. BGYM27]
MKSELDKENYQKWLVDKCIYKGSTLTIELVCGVTSDEKQDLDLGDGIEIKGVYAVEPKGERFRVYFDDVVLLQAFDECAHKTTDHQFRDEGVVGQYKSSTLLDYVRNETLLMDIMPGELMHFEVMTGDDWFHVITREAPVVSAVVNA